jgi:hypothetical protein
VAVIVEKKAMWAPFFGTLESLRVHRLHDMAGCNEASGRNYMNSSIHFKRPRSHNFSQGSNGMAAE